MTTLLETRHFKVTHAPSKGELRAHLKTPEAKAWSESCGESGDTPMRYDYAAGSSGPKVPDWVKDEILRNEFSIDTLTANTKLLQA